MSNRWIRALVSGSLLLALGCVVQPVNRDSALNAAEPQIRFNVQTVPSGVHVEINGDNPLVYTAFRLPDPPRLIIDLAGVSFSPDQQPVTVNQGAVTSITPIPASTDADVARLEIALTELVDYQLRPDGTRLLVAIAAPSSDVPAVDPAASAEVNPEPLSSLPEAQLPPAPDLPVAAAESQTPPVTVPDAAPPSPATNQTPSREATTVTAIQVVPNTTPLQVKIQGDGTFHPATMMLDGPRLVIDLPGTSSKVTRPKIAVNGPLLRQIRVGEHTTPQKVRVVLDLAAAADYQLDQQEHALMVTLSPTGRPATPAAVEPAPSAPSQAVQATEKKASDHTAVALPTPPKRQKTASAQMESAENGNGPNRVVTEQKKFTGRMISLDFQEADLDDVLRLMADVSGLNVVVGESVKGKVTVKLLNVPWDQALDLILRTNGLGQVREGNILRIDTLVNLAKQQDDEAKAKESSIRAEDLVTRVMYVNYATAAQLAETLRKNLSPRGEIMIDVRTNAIILKDIESKAEEVTALLKVLDLQTPQVLIEARIVSADSNFARDLGVQWGGTFSATSGPFQFGAITGPSGTVVGAPTPGFLVNLPASGGAGPLGNLGFTLGRFTGNPFVLDLRLSAGEKQGLSKTISSPRIAVLDNQEAKIQQGTSIPYLSTTDNQVTTIFVDATLLLEVTPHVTPDGSILMKVRIANDEPGPTTSQGLPSINKKDAKTSIMVRDGETAVLGGVFKSSEIKSVSGVPFLQKIPGLGWLFKQESKSNSTNELLVFLTPKIIR